MSNSSKSRFTWRDKLITQVSYGTLTPKEAEAKAAQRGCPPFASQPKPGEFDPECESRWSIVMAVAWIVWRDMQVVRDHFAAFRAECTHWVPRNWMVPAESGQRQKIHQGHLLEPWSKTTVARLALGEALLAELGGYPAKQMPVSIGRQALWRALQAGQLVAEAMDQGGKPVDIPAREWSYLKLFEERNRDVLKYETLGSRGGIPRSEAEAGRSS